MLLGGALTQYLSWRWCLYVNVGLAVVALAGAMVWLHQLGGSTGTSLLNTLAASAAPTYLASRTATAPVIAQASVHGYVTAFWWSAGIFAVGAVLCGVLLTGRVPSADLPVPE